MTAMTAIQDLPTNNSQAVPAQDGRVLEQQLKEVLSDLPLHGSLPKLSNPAMGLASNHNIEQPVLELPKGGVLNTATAQQMLNEISGVEGFVLELLEVQVVTAGEHNKSTQLMIKVAADLKIEVNNQRVEALKEHRARIEKAKKLNILTKVFLWVGAALGVAISGGVLLTAGLTVPAVALGISTAITLTHSISQETGGWLTRMFGDGDKAQMAAGYFVMGLAIAFSIGSAAGMVKGANTILVGAEKAAASAKNASSLATQQAYIEKVGAKIVKGAMVVQGFQDVGEAASDSVASYFDYEAQNYHADAVRLLGFMKVLDYQIQDDVEHFESIYNFMNKNATHALEIFSINYETSHEITEKV